MKCGNFQDCSVNKCPLDSISRIVIPEDTERECRISKSEILLIKNGISNTSLNREQMKRVTSIIKKECCNYDSGDCVLLDNGKCHKCTQIGDSSIDCNWFKDAVLPLDQVLENSIKKQITDSGVKVTKRCSVCNKAFIPKSNKAKYCEKCLISVTKKQNSERQRKRRLTSRNRVV